MCDVTRTVGISIYYALFICDGYSLTPSYCLVNSVQQTRDYNCCGLHEGYMRWVQIPKKPLPGSLACSHRMQVLNIMHKRSCRSQVLLHDYYRSYYAAFEKNVPPVLQTRMLNISPLCLYSLQVEMNLRWLTEISWQYFGVRKWTTDLPRHHFVCAQKPICSQCLSSMLLSPSLISQVGSRAGEKVLGDYLGGIQFRGISLYGTKTEKLLLFNAYSVFYLLVW